MAAGIAPVWPSLATCAPLGAGGFLLIPASGHPPQAAGGGGLTVGEAALEIPLVTRALPPGARGLGHSGEEQGAGPGL